MIAPSLLADGGPPRSHRLSPAPEDGAAHAGEQPTRVLYVLKRYPRLSETFVVREILGLESAGVAVGIEGLLPPEPGPRHPEVARVQAHHRVLPRRPELRQRPVLAAHGRLALRNPRRWVRVAAGASRRPGGWRRFLQAGLVAERAQREGFVHLHAHFATAAADVASTAAALSGLTWSVTAHAKDVFNDLNAAQLTRRLETAAAVVTVTEHNVAHLRRILGERAPEPGVAPHRRVHLVRNGVPLAPAHGPNLHGPVVCVARLVEKKGIDRLLDALWTLAAHGRNVPALIVGDGPLRGQLEAQAAALGLADLVTFTGAVDSAEVAAVYARASMVVLPCRIAVDGDRDGLPTVLTEALARALPVVSTDVVGIPELVQHERTGLLVPPEDAAALAAAIERLLDDDGLARRLGRAGRQLVSDAYAPDRSTVALLAAFSAAVVGPGRRGAL